METTHKVYFKNASDMSEIKSNSIDLIITSPPYPMIEIWDPLFLSLNSEIKQALEEGKGKSAFDLMHQELDKVWIEVTRVLKDGGMVCVNVGDATRKIGNSFQLFPNHIKIANSFLNKEFIELPSILWRKPTNSPNKFMGSGMLPPHAYITLEHEYILIFRKGNAKREIPSKSETRYNSAYFWEERNSWFSDIWMDIIGASQEINNNKKDSDVRKRSAAFPLELPYRLINMFSLYGDTILDPFWGTGTTSLAAMISSRNSIGYEISSEFSKIFKKNIKNLKQLNLDINKNRINQHVDFIKKYNKKGKQIKYNSVYYKLPVVTKQEIDILLYSIKDVSENRNEFKLTYEKFKLDNKPY
ncbi:MAG: DNA-methyltransferase [Candidatus Hermodarchaeota archaeon]